MGLTSPPWYDSAFGQLYRFDHRYLVEIFAVILFAFVVHFGYGVLSDRQHELAIQRNRSTSDQMPGASISIGAITNSGAGSSTQINQEVPKHKTGSK